MDIIGNNYSYFSRNASDLCAFVMVCRHGQLSSAAREMKISQPSLSQRIKNLEAAVGTVLFDRTSKGVALTQSGLNLYRSIEQPLTDAAGSFQSFLEKNDTERVMISVDYAFSSFWLLPRIPQMREALGDANICVLTSQNPVKDAGPDIDLTIHMAGRHQVKGSETLLLPERVSAICSPAFKQEITYIHEPADLVRNPNLLLHLNSPSAEAHWCGWQEWFKHLDVHPNDISKDVVFSNYEMIIRAAIAGQGVVLGWHGLIEHLFNGRDLAMLFPNMITTERGYYIGLHQNTPSPIARTLHDWIITEMAISGK